MSEWKEVTLSDVTSVLGDGIHGTPKYSNNGDYYFINGNNLCEGKIVFKSDTKRVSEDEYIKYRKELTDRTLLFSINGTVGNVAKYNGEPCILGKSACYFNIIDSVDKDYIYYVVSSPSFVKSMSNLANGTTIKNVSLKQMREKKISLPPLDIQGNIASILSSLDDKIAVNKKICENLEAQAQALFKHWFVDFAPFKDGKFVESELGMIPEGWRVGRLEELCSFISRGLSPKYQLGTNELVLGQTCVRNNVVTLDNAREHQPKVNCNKFVEKWDVLLNSTGIGSLGRVGIIYFDNKNVCFDSHLTVVRTAEEIYRYYVGRNLLNRQKELENMAVGSTGQTELPKKDVLVMPILIPNSDVLPEFNEIIKNIGNTIYLLIEENRRLATLRDTLLPKLMSGQIKVNEIEKSL